MSEVVDGPKPFLYGKHVEAFGACATLTSLAASPFMSDYRTVGYVLAGVSILLSAAVTILRSIDMPRSRVRWLLLPLIAISIGSIGLLGWSYFHPHVEKAVSVPAAVKMEAPVTDAHTEYKIQTSGKNSPVITGGSGTVILGDQPAAGRRVKGRP